MLSWQLDYRMLELSLIRISIFASGFSIHGRGILEFFASKTLEHLRPRDRRAILSLQFRHITARAWPKPLLESEMPISGRSLIGPLDPNRNPKQERDIYAYSSFRPFGVDQHLSCNQIRFDPVRWLAPAHLHTFFGYYLMGNSVLDGRTSAVFGDGIITKFYTSAAWIEGRAEAQLNEVAGWTGVQKIAAFPDLHPGKYGPVGFTVLADRIFPQLIGNDIGCGMSLFQLDLPVRKLKLEKALRRMRVLGEPASEDQCWRLEHAGLPTDLFATFLGTVGGGNHFCEVQTLAEADDSTCLDASRLYLLVHSGSRGFGNAVLGSVPNGAFAGLDPESDAAWAYLQDHDRAVRWASLNRQIIAERAAEALRADLTLLVDALHNLLARHSDGWLHRKGAAVAEVGFVPLAGSRASASYLMAPTGRDDALASLAHGAGRRYERSSMHGRVRAKKSDLETMRRTSFGGRILCEDRDLLIEEAPLAYKSAKSVFEDLERTGAAHCVAEFHPLLTFKKLRDGRRS